MARGRCRTGTVAHDHRRHGQRPSATRPGADPPHRGALRRRLWRRHPSAGRRVRQGGRPAAARFDDPAGLPRGNPRPGRHHLRRVRLPNPVRRRRRAHPRRPSRCVVRVQPGGAQDEPRGAQARRIGGGRSRRLLRTQLEAGRVHGKSARRQRPQPLPRLVSGHRTAHRTRRGGDGRWQEASRPGEELLVVGALFLALRGRARADHRVDQRQVRQGTGGGGFQHRGTERGARLWRDLGARCRRRRPRQGGHTAPRCLPHRHRHGRDGLGPRRGGGALRPQAHLLLLSDHPRLGTPALSGRAQGARRDDIPSGGRNRLRHRRHRRVLCRRLGCDGKLRAGARAERRSPRPGRGGGTATAHHRRAARRTIHGHAHQAGAGGPQPRHVRAPRRGAAAGAGASHPRRVLPNRHRSRPHRHEVHDAGAGAFGRLHRQRRRTVGTAGCGCSAGLGAGVSH